jgi:ABC-type uncharacterized transport system ATPase subunit
MADAAMARGPIGMVFQHFSLFEQLTVAGNVALGLDKAPRAGASTTSRREREGHSSPRSREG